MEVEEADEVVLEWEEEEGAAVDKVYLVLVDEVVALADEEVKLVEEVRQAAVEEVQAVEVGHQEEEVHLQTAVVVYPEATSDRDHQVGSTPQ